MKINYCQNQLHSSSQTTIEISKDFLNTHGLRHFCYARFNPENNSLLTLTTHPEAHEDFLSYDFYKKLDFNQIPSSKALLWSGLDGPSVEIIKHSREYYNLGNGIALTKHYDSIYENFYFSSTPENIAINNFYLSNLDLLYNFCFYFKEKAKHLIQKENKNSIVLPLNALGTKKSDINYPARNIMINIENPLFKKIYYSTDFSKNLSKREFQCLNRLALGKRACTIASELDLAERTVRSYIEHLKEKTKLHSITQLIQFYHDLF